MWAKLNTKTTRPHPLLENENKRQNPHKTRALRTDHDQVFQRFDDISGVWGIQRWSLGYWDILAWPLKNKISDRAIGIG